MFRDVLCAGSFFEMLSVLKWDLAFSPLIQSSPFPQCEEAPIIKPGLSSTWCILRNSPIPTNLKRTRGKTKAQLEGLLIGFHLEMRRGFIFPSRECSRNSRPMKCTPTSRGRKKNKTPTKQSLSYLTHELSFRRCTYLQ